jgi:hypothetical protein
MAEDLATRAEGAKAAAMKHNIKSDIQLDTVQGEVNSSSLKNRSI